MVAENQATISLFGIKKIFKSGSIAKYSLNFVNHCFVLLFPGLSSINFALEFKANNYGYKNTNTKIRKQWF